MHRIDDELIEETAFPGDEVAGPVDGRSLGFGQLTEAAVSSRRGLFDESQRANELGEMADRNAGDRKIRHRPQSVHAPIGVRGHIDFAEEIVFAAGRNVGESDRAGRSQRKRRVRLGGYGGICRSLLAFARRFFRHEWRLRE